MHNFMKAKIKTVSGKLLTLCFIAFGYLLFSGCQKGIEELGTTQQKRYTDFFTTPQKLDYKAQKVVDALKHFDSTQHFLNKLPGRLGRPLWGKMMPAIANNYANRSVGDSGETTGIAIPLSEDNEFLSGVIVAKINDDTISSFKVFDNDYFYKVTHGSTFDSTKGKKALGLFFNDGLQGIWNHKV